MPSQGGEQGEEKWRSRTSKSKSWGQPSAAVTQLVLPSTPELLCFLPDEINLHY